MKWQQLRSLIESEGKASKLVKDALFQKYLANRFVKHDFPIYEKAGRAEGEAGQTRYVKQGKMWPFTPAATRLNMQGINSPFPQLDLFPDVSGMELTALFEAKLFKEFRVPGADRWWNRHNKKSSQRQCLIGINTDMKVVKNQLLGTNEPASVPTEVLNFFADNEYPKAIKEAQDKAEKRADEFGDVLHWFNAFGNFALLNFLHKLYCKGNKELILNVGKEELRTHHYLGYIIFNDWDVDRRDDDRYLRLSIEELAIGIPVWLDIKNWLVPAAFKITGNIMLKRDCISYDCKYKFYADDDSKYLPLSFRNLPNEYKWQVSSKNNTTVTAKVFDNIQLFLFENLSQLLVGAYNGKFPEDPLDINSLKVVGHEGALYNGNRFFQPIGSTQSKAEEKSSKIISESQNNTFKI